MHPPRAARYVRYLNVRALYEPESPWPATSPWPTPIAEHVHDGDTVALEGFTHLIPFAAGHEIIRQGRRDLTLVRMTPDVVYDQMIGAGCARKLDLQLGWQPRCRLAAPLP